MLVLHDYECPAGHRQEDVLHTTGKVPATIRCQACRKRARRVISRRSNFVKFQRDAGTMYGRFDPQFGCVVENYEQRQALMRQKGMIDADDAVGGDRERMDEGQVQGEMADQSQVQVVTDLADLKAPDTAPLRLSEGDRRKMKRDQLGVFGGKK